MPVVRNIGKNTLGDNNKMSVSMHDYSMSTHDLSTVFRSTLGVGTLTPCLKLLAQKGDTFDIKLKNKTLTQPTQGAMFGTYKLQHFFFFAGFRLYNSWLHNNRTGIGMDMKKIKLPMMATTKLELSSTKFHNSSLYKYLGWTGTGKGKGSDSCVYKNGVPLLMYLDIFKNYFANTQEDKFYFINRRPNDETQEIKGWFTNEVSVWGFSGNNPTEPSKQKWSTLEVNNTSPEEGKQDAYIVTFGRNNIDLDKNSLRITFKQGIAIEDLGEIYIAMGEGIDIGNRMYIQQLKNIGHFSPSIHNILFVLDKEKAENAKPIDMTTTNIPVTEGFNEVATGDYKTLNNTVRFVRLGVFTKETTTFEKTETYPEIIEEELETLELIRDEILKTDGDTTYKLGHKIGENQKVKKLFETIEKAQISPLGGLLLKTYDSDINNNWIKSEWIEGENSISAITAIALEDGKLSLDTLNLQQKVYNMLNRIAVSGGTYRDWLETVYTAGRYLDRPETPVFIGGMTQYINFQEINATTNGTTADGREQPLGDIASIGRGGDPTNSGRIHYTAEEPGYIMGIIAITPMLDYSQGNDFDLNLETMDDLHKPALDGIGYQDLTAEQMLYNTTIHTKTGMPSDTSQLSIGKTVAWIDYMTNVNHTYGEFAEGGSLDFMVFNRKYETEDDGLTFDATTYIDPIKHIEIFADTDITSQNFWVQTAMDIKKRGNYSAKQIPNL